VGTSGRRRPILAVVLAVVPAVVLAAGCGGGDGGTATSPATVPNSAATSAALPDENRARAVAENMLIAYNTGDYQAFSRDFAGPVKVAVGERAFTEFRAETLPVTGRFERLVSVTPTAGQGDPDHAEYDVNADFERRQGAIFTMILSAQDEVEGIEFRRPT
jgi:hypothetical protein